MKESISRTPCIASAVKRGRQMTGEASKAHQEGVDERMGEEGVGKPEEGVILKAK